MKKFDFILFLEILIQNHFPKFINFFISLLPIRQNLTLLPEWELMLRFWLEWLESFIDYFFKMLFY